MVHLSIRPSHLGRCTTVTRMEIRHVEIGDARGIAEVHVGSWQVAYADLIPRHDLDELDISQFEAWRGRRIEAMDLSHSATVVATDDGRVLGFADVGPSRDEDQDENTVGELYAIYLDPSEWDKGYGRQLIKAAEEAMAERGFTSAMLWVLEGNARARDFYEAAGWRPDGSRQEEKIITALLHEVRYTKTLS